MMAGKFLPLVCFLTVVFCLVGCASSSSNPAPAAPAVSPNAAYVGSGQSMQFTTNIANGSSGVTWAVSSSGSSTPSGAINSQGNFTAPPVTQNTTITVTATSMKDPTLSASATVIIIAPATVAATANAQVALYTISVPDGLAAFIQFSTDTSYGFSTWSVAAPSGGGAVPILVAGMKGNTAYHMRAVFQPTGTTTTVFTDSDHTFTTTSYPAANLPSLSAATAQGQTPQPGVELLDLITIGSSSKLNTVVTDLAGNVLWAYSPGTSVSAVAAPNPIKLLPNGHFLIVYSGTSPDGQASVVQEVDLAGAVVWQMNSAQLNAALTAAASAGTCAGDGCGVTVVGFHHDFAVRPNGHIVFIASTEQSVTLTGDTTPTNIVGDVLIDLDQNHNPVWVWNSFDGQLDVNRHPMSFPPDWLHSNAVVYSPDDKALMLSMRHQAWVIKINYNDGAGDGHIMWKLGYQGDFALQSGTTNATSPVDWFNAQHDANIISTTTAGTLDVLMFDNGDQRILNPSGALCAPSTTPCDSRVPVIHLDESAKTADITWIDRLAPLFSFFGGSARLLKNGNIEFDECAATPLPSENAAIFEVTETTPPVTVWSMQIAGQYAYRGIRIPSLYPGVQW
jgi:arylsulfate sulfotransferase